MMQLARRQRDNHFLAIAVVAKLCPPPMAGR